MECYIAEFLRILVFIMIGLVLPVPMYLASREAKKRLDNDID